MIAGALVAVALLDRDSHSRLLLSHSSNRPTVSGSQFSSTILSSMMSFHLPCMIALSFSDFSRMLACARNEGWVGPARISNIGLVKGLDKLSLDHKVKIIKCVFLT